MFGDTFSDLYEAASEKAKAASDAMAQAYDATKVAASDAYDATKKFASETYDTAKTEGAKLYKTTAEATTVAVNKVKNTASDVADYSAQKYEQAKTVAGDAKDAFVKSATEMTDAAVDAVTQTCDQAKQNWKDNTEDSGWEFKNKLTVATDDDFGDPKSKWKSKGYRDDGDDVTDGSSSTLKLGVQREASSSLQRWGDEDDNISLGNAEGEALLGIKYDPVESDFKAGAFTSGSISVVSAEGDSQFLHDAIELEGSGEALGVGGGLNVGGQKSKDFTGAIVEGEIEAVLVKVEGEGVVNITPNTIYANSIGAVVDYFWPGSDYASLPDYMDHGVVVGAGGELGIGAAVGAEGYAGKKHGAYGAGAQVKAGAGPLAALKLFVGVK